MIAHTHSRFWQMCTSFRSPTCIQERNMKYKCWQQQRLGIQPRVAGLGYNRRWVNQPRMYHFPLRSHWRCSMILAVIQQEGWQLRYGKIKDVGTDMKSTAINWLYFDIISQILQVDWEVSSENKVEIEGFWLKYKRQDQTWNEPITFPPTQKSYTITGLGE